MSGPEGTCCHRPPLFNLMSTYGSMILDTVCGLHLCGAVQRHISEGDPILVLLIRRDAAPLTEGETELQPLGGFLRCESCHHTKPLGDVGKKLGEGWPKHCGYTMRWWTQRQIDAGEVEPPEFMEAIN